MSNPFDASASLLGYLFQCRLALRPIPWELFAKFQTGFYANAKDAVFKALGVQ